MQNNHCFGDQSLLTAPPGITMSAQHIHDVSVTGLALSSLLEVICAVVAQPHHLSHDGRSRDPHTPPLPACDDGLPSFLEHNTTLSLGLCSRTMGGNNHRQIEGGDPGT